MAKKRKVEDLNPKDLIESHYPFYNFSFWNINNPKIWLELVHIDLSNNKITSLPKELGTLLNLRELILSKNCLGTCDQLNWSWMKQTAIKNKLVVLNLCNNSLTELPEYIWNLHALVQLKICHNMLMRLSQKIQNLSKLRFLELSNNRLLYLPGSLTKMPMLYFANISRNSFSLHQKFYINTVTRMPMLTELSAKVILNSRISYDHLPHVLVQYLNETENCYYCGQFCFRDRRVRSFTRCIVSMIAEILKNLSNRNIKMECYYCSQHCHISSQIVLNNMFYSHTTFEN